MTPQASPDLPQAGGHGTAVPGVPNSSICSTTALGVHTTALYPAPLHVPNSSRHHHTSLLPKCWPGGKSCPLPSDPRPWEQSCTESWVNGSGINLSAASSRATPKPLPEPLQSSLHYYPNCLNTQASCRCCPASPVHRSSPLKN